MKHILCISLTLFLCFPTFAGDLILKDKNKTVMVAIKTDEIGNSRVRLSAWMNAQHKTGNAHCTLSGSIKVSDSMKPISFSRSLLLLPGEYVPFYLGSFGRDFDPSESIVAKVNCQSIALPKASKAQMKRSKTVSCCELAGYTSACAASDDDEGVVVSFENQGGKMLGLELCVTK